MQELQQLAAEFVRWWVHPSGMPLFRERFAPGISYQLKPSGLADEEALWLLEQALPWEHVEVKSLAATGDVATVEIEGTDPVTLLRHRVLLTLRVAQGRIVSVVEHHEPAR